MIINDKEAASRLNSPMNLINRLKSVKGERSSAMSLFIPSASQKLEEKAKLFNPFVNKPSEIIPLSEQPAKQTTLDNILENHESQIRLGLAHDKALDLLNTSVNMLSNKLDEVKADKLPAVIREASRVVDAIRKERNENIKNSKDREVHYHFYTPNQKAVEEYEVIDVA